MIELLAGVILVIPAVNLVWGLLYGLFYVVVNGAFILIVGIATVLGWPARLLALLQLRPIRIWLDRVHPRPVPPCPWGCTKFAGLVGNCPRCGQPFPPYPSRPTTAIGTP
jgi:hypothetical protein